MISHERKINLIHFFQDLRLNYITEKVWTNILEFVDNDVSGFISLWLAGGTPDLYICYAEGCFNSGNNFMKAE
jgi:hypothetical protein